MPVFIAFLGIGIIVQVMPVFAKELGASGFALGMIFQQDSVWRVGGLIVSFISLVVAVMLSGGYERKIS